MDTAVMMVNRVHAARKADNITGVLLKDLNTAFLSVATGKLIHAMKGKKIEGDLIR